MYDSGHMVDFLGKQLMDGPDRTLLNMALSSGISQADLDSLLSVWDIEKAPIHSVMLMAYLSKIHPELTFPETVLPRLQGVLTFSRFQTLKLSAHFHKIAEALNGKGISFILLKGGAMKVYRPDFPRWMSDIDALVPAPEFKAAVATVKGLGYIPLRCAHSVDLRAPGTKDNIVDIHRFIQMDTGKERRFNKVLAERAVKRDFFSSEVLVPSPEDMVFISLVNFWKNIAHKTSEGSVVSSFFDLKYLVENKPGFDWETVRSNARLTGSTETVYLAAKLLDSLAPGILPERFLEDEAVPKKAEKILKRTIYQRDVLCPLRDEIGEFNLIEAYKARKPFWKYISLRTKYFFLKRVRLPKRVTA